MRRLCALLLTWTVRQFVSRRAGKPKNSVPFRNKAIMAATVQISGGDVIYTPDAGFVGGDNFGYTVTDAQGDTADASVDITVTNPVPTPLIASNYSETTAIGTPISVDLLDEDSGYVGLPTITTGPAHGTVSL